MTSFFIKYFFISSLFFSMVLSMTVAAQTCKSYIPDNNPSERYINHDDGTVTDKDTGLMWKQCVEGQSGINNCAIGSNTKKNWKDALLEVGKVNESGFAGYADWRLANLTELDSLVTQNCYSPSINSSVFPADPATHVWSSSPNMSKSDNSWTLDFSIGKSYSYPRGNHVKTMRLVRLGV
jgi:hypothetical protein